MLREKQMKTANRLRSIARYTMLTIGILLFVFALLSGAEEGVQGIIKNSPNALPGMALLVIVFIAWKWELVGGVLIVLLGLFATWFFSFRANNFSVPLFIIVLFIILMGAFFLISWYLQRKNEK